MFKCSQKRKKCSHGRKIRGMASVVARRSKSGMTSFQVRWRDPDVGQQQSITFTSESEAMLLKRFLDGNGQSFSIAQQAMESSRRQVPTVADVIQEHIDLLVRPASGTLRTYQTMLDLHIKPVLGAILIDELDLRQVTAWVRGMQKKGKSTKTIRNNHALIFAAMERAVQLKYRADNPCRGVDLPSGERVEDDARFLTHAEYSLLLSHIAERLSLIHI